MLTIWGLGFDGNTVFEVGSGICSEGTVYPFDEGSVVVCTLPEGAGIVETAALYQNGSEIGNEKLPRLFSHLSLDLFFFSQSHQRRQTRIRSTPSFKCYRQGQRHMQTNRKKLVKKLLAPLILPLLLSTLFLMLLFTLWPCSDQNVPALNSSK